MNASAPSAAASRGPADHEVREQIMAAAEEHFRRYGFEKTTVSDLAKAIGFSKAYIYKFFDSKQAIGEAICSQTLRAFIAAVEEEVAGAPTEKFRRMFKTLTSTAVTLFFNDRKLYDLAAYCAREGSSSSQAFVESVKRILMEIVRAGRDNGHAGWRRPPGPDPSLAGQRPGAGPRRGGRPVQWAHRRCHTGVGRRRLTSVIMT